MKIRWWHSLRLRIALVIFLLEAVLLGVVLWETQSHATERARQLIQEQDTITLELLAEDANQVMMTLAFDRLTDIFRQAAGNPHIENILLTDERDIVLASSDPRLLGKPLGRIPEPAGCYRRAVPLETAAGELGQLQVMFSNDRLNQLYRESLRLGLGIGFVGMLLIALAGIGLGHLLTRRLERLTRHAEAIAAGRDVRPVVIDGADEVTALSRAFNRMIGSLDRHARRMKRMAYQDPLTGLANRIAFRDCLGKALDSARRYGSRHCLLYLDLDRFKRVNDTCGHEAGDRLLAELSAVLRRTLRLRDTIARLGGDEFGVLLDRTGLAEGRVVAEKLRQTVERFHYSTADRTFHVGVSIGLVEIDAHAGDIDAILRRADQACYAAKEKGRNTVEIADQHDAADDRST